MADFDIRKLKLKTSPELTDDEKSFLITNKTELNDEDKAAYADWLPEEISGIKFGEVENPELKTSVSDDDADDSGQVDEAEEDKVDDTPPAPTPPPAQYATPADVANAIDKSFERLIPFLSPREIKEQKEEAKSLFDKDKKYTLEEASALIKRDAVDEAVKVIEKKQAEKTEATNKELQGWVNQYNTLATEKKLPAINTKEGKEMWEKLDQIGGKYGLNSFSKAYEIYELLPEDKGGAVKVEAKDDIKKEVEKKKMSAQKAAAGKVSGGKGAESSGKTQKKYADIHAPLDQYIQTH